jgi:prevent-host-death family protein
MTSRLGTRELRASLAAALRRARAGERMIITESGRPVAQLGPVESSPDAADGTPRQVTMDELVARGLVVPPRRRAPETGVRIAPIETYSGVRFDRVVRDLR